MKTLAYGNVVFNYENTSVRNLMNVCFVNRAHLFGVAKICLSVVMVFLFSEIKMYSN